MLASFKKLFQIKVNPFFIILVIISCLSSLSFAQDRIYTSNGSYSEGEIIKINQQNIEYKIISGNSELIQTIPSFEVLLIFFPNGQYLTYPFGDVDPMLHKSYPNLPNDVLITRLGETLQGKIISIENNRTNFRLNGSSSDITLDFSELLIGIYANGKHAIFKDPRESLPVLNYVSKNVLELAQSKTSNQNLTTANSGRPNYVKNSSQNVQSQAIVPINANSNTYNPTPTENTNNNELSDVDFAEFSDKAMQKIDDLGSFISIISDKQTFPDQANQAIDLAINLFVNEESTVEVSTVGYTATIKRKIRDYLNRLKLLKYDRVEVKWADLNYVSNFRKGPDGNYYGTVSLKQTFQGFLDNKLLYSDVTEKQIEVVIKGMDKTVDGKEQLVWDVLLSDIGVLDTKN